MGIISWISKKAMRHSSRGDFDFQERKPVRMRSGGHGQENLDYLRSNMLSHSIDTEFDNGVRTGHIENHKKRINRSKNGHAWFPTSWSKQDIRDAGIYVAGLKRNSEHKENICYGGRYKGVSTGIYCRKKKIQTVFPLFDVNKYARRKNNAKYHR